MRIQCWVQNKGYIGYIGYSLDCISSLYPTIMHLAYRPEQLIPASYACQLSGGELGGVRERRAEGEQGFHSSLSVRPVSSPRITGNLFALG
jgi:hypothetical protein